MPRFLELLWWNDDSLVFISLFRERYRKKSPAVNFVSLNCSLRDFEISIMNI